MEAVKQIACETLPEQLPELYNQIERAILLRQEMRDSPNRKSTGHEPYEINVDHGLIRSINICA